MNKIHHFQSRQVINEEAVAWVLAFNGDEPLSESDIQTFCEWAGRSSVHREALNRAESFWSDADLLSELAVPFKRSCRGACTRFFSHVWAQFQLMGKSGALMAALILGFSITLSVWLVPMDHSSDNGIYHAAIGEQKLLTLNDGSLIQLDTNSQVRVDYQKSTRKIYLLRGKAHFDVSKKLNRPFEVYARDGLVRAVGTAFSVYLDENDVRVIVGEGRVELARMIMPATGLQSIESASTSTVVDSHVITDSRMTIEKNQVKKTEPIKPLPQKKLVGIEEIFLSLDKGQGASFNRHQQSLVELADNELSKELAWRRGLLIFSGDSLEHVIDEVNRYTETTIEISDPALRKLVVGGRFRVGELEELFDVLEEGFGVQVSYLSERHVQLRLSSTNH